MTTVNFKPSIHVSEINDKSWFQTNHTCLRNRQQQLASIQPYMSQKSRTTVGFKPTIPLRNHGQQLGSNQPYMPQKSKTTICFKLTIHIKIFLTLFFREKTCWKDETGMLCGATNYVFIYILK